MKQHTISHFEEAIATEKSISCINLRLLTYVRNDNV